MNWTAVVLAAGAGVRMRSGMSKPLHRVAGVPLVGHVCAAARAAGVSDIVVVVGAGHTEAAEFQDAAGSGARLVEQPERLGTADAVRAALGALESASGSLLVLNGDAPLLRPETIRTLQAAHESAEAAVTIATATGVTLDGLGRVVRDGTGAVRAVVEQKDASAEVLESPEVNAGWYAFDVAWLGETLPSVQKSDSGEYYLTSLVAMAADSGKGAASVALSDPNEMLGVNSRAELAMAEGAMRDRLRQYWMGSGVTLIDPDTAYIDASAQLSQDVTVHPNSHILGATVIAEGCEVGPNSIVIDTVMEAGSRIVASYAESARIGQRVAVGPFSRLRPGAVIADDVYVGNFAEIKNSTVGAGSHIGHFSYVGDSDLGRRVNIGAGTVTVNYDGKDKHRTIIEDDAFVGSGSMLVAPVRIGRSGATAAGAVVTRDVAENTTVAGVPARPMSKSKRLLSEATLDPSREGPAEPTAANGGWNHVESGRPKP